MNTQQDQSKFLNDFWSDEGQEIMSELESLTSEQLDKAKDFIEKLKDAPTC